MTKLRTLFIVRNHTTGAALRLPEWADVLPLVANWSGTVFIGPSLPLPILRPSFRVITVTLTALKGR